jgi:hypothetical protein
VERNFGAVEQGLKDAIATMSDTIQKEIMRRA